MRLVCGHGDVGRRLSIEGIRDEISWVWNPTAYKAFLAMLSGLGNPEACFLSGIKAFFIEHRGYNDLCYTAEGGNDVAAYVYAILLYRDNGGVAADDTAKGYMRRVAGGDSMTSRWLSNEGCLPLCEKAVLAIHYSTWCIWGESCRLWNRCAAISRAQAPAAAWKKYGFEFLCFAAKTIGCAAKW
jgi:hypothetical protein